FIVISFAVTCIFLCYYFFRGTKNKETLKLPPGSMGWPFVGETLRLYSDDPNVFFSDKLTRYGEIFKTHILRCPCVILGSPEAVRFVLVSGADLFRPTYPKSKEALIGPNALFFHEGEYHASLRKLVQTALSPKSARKILPAVDAIAAAAVESWVSRGTTVNTFREMKKFSFRIGILAVFGELEDRHKEEIEENYFILDKGYNSFPVNIPGTRYRKALTARRRLNDIVDEIIVERKNADRENLLDVLLRHEGDRFLDLNRHQIVDNIIGVLFAAQDTTASALTWILKYLHQHRDVLEALRVEHASNREGNKSLTWTQIRNMPFTYKVIMESLRMASIVSFTFREAVVDVEYNGYIIPKGWKVMPLFRNIHYNPEYFNNPHKFDPYRFEV
ncbi:hypothetical protein M569_09716, partial [Genlisea aurea]